MINSDCTCQSLVGFEMTPFLTGHVRGCPSFVERRRGPIILEPDAPVDWRARALAAEARAAELAVKVADLEAFVAQKVAERDDAIASATREAAGRDALGNIVERWLRLCRCIECGIPPGYFPHAGHCKIGQALAALAEDRKGGNDG